MNRNVFWAGAAISIVVVSWFSTDISCRKAGESGRAQTDEGTPWRGTATDIVSDNPEKNDRKLKKALEKMFKKYPPEKLRKQ